MNIIEITNLSKSFKNIKAVQNLSIKVKEGELYAFLGLNGAGKSTTISIMCGELDADEGTVIIDGIDTKKDVQKIKNKIGVVYQKSVLDKDLSVYDNLQSRAALYGIYGSDFEKRLKELSELFLIDNLMKRTYGKLSGGEKRRIDIIRALIHKPKILILDEPTTGLDPQTRKLVWDIVNNLRKEEKITVFLTTHYMEEVTDADYVVILDSGIKSAEGTPLELKNKYTNDFITLYSVNLEDVQKLGLPYEKLPDAYRIEVKNTKEATKLIMEKPHLFVDYEITKGKMDDVFLSVTGKKLPGGLNK
ncbi:MAG: ABC transporter ATP-binding protein [Bacilli bacterium]|nr:ABC transporter ATP-binding protein [Bacilli bacterium]